MSPLKIISHSQNLSADKLWLTVQIRNYFICVVWKLYNGCTVLLCLDEILRDFQ